ncbi:hypothetical protein BSPWISOXPB_9732 [uncultured Gammaproteobacteria bacterium]|jgi:diketogulonate reductase-like aldo/keto reductase|nr:hypothetical protein BSPWISOXPB_9732 [uncultured Gammaproteobacteria bacterium]
MKILEIRTDTGGSDLIPHTFLYIYEKGKKDEGKGYGFAPIKTGLTGVGKVWDDTGHEHQALLARTIQITETQYQSLMDGIAISKVDPPFYSILGGAQCTTWAMEQLNDAGIIRSDVSVGASNFFTNLVETIQNNPYSQGSDQFRDNIVEKVAVVIG